MFGFLNDQTFWTWVSNAMAFISLGVAIWAQRWAARSAKMKIPAPTAYRRFDGSVEITIPSADVPLFAIAAVKIARKKISKAVLTRDPDPKHKVRIYVSDGSELSILRYDPSVSVAIIVGVSYSDLLWVSVASRAAKNARSWIALTIT